MTDVKDTGPLTWNVPITDVKTGRPTPEFQRRWEQQRANNSLIGSVTLGSGAPVDPAPNGAQYIDTSVEPYVLYVGDGGVWHQVSARTFLDLMDTPSSYTADAIVNVNGAGDALEFTMPSGFTANPTAVASDTAVNGSASTFMRSDAAPAVQLASSSQFGIVKVDGTTITETGGVISSSGGGGGSGNVAVTYFPSGGFSANDTGAFATLANAFIPGEAMQVDKVYGAFNNAVIGNVYSMFIAEVNSSGTILATVATAALPYTTVATGFQQVEFTLTSVASLVPTKIYIVALVITSGLTTTPCRAVSGGANPFNSLPLDHGAMATLGGAIRRYWYTQNSASPVSSVPVSTSATLPYCLGVRRIAATGIGGPAPWVTVGSWNFATHGAVANVDSALLTDYSEVWAQFDDVNVSAGRVVLLLSVDGTTYYNTSGNYAEVAATGVQTNNAALFGNSTTSAAVRSSSFHIPDTKTILPARHVVLPIRQTTQVFKGSTAQILKIRAIAASSAGVPGGTITAGSITMLAR